MRVSSLDASTLAAPLQVLLVVEDPLARAGLMALLGGEPGVVVRGAPLDKKALRALVEERAADVIVVDVGPGGDALDIVPATGSPVLALLAPGQSPTEALSSGARGVLPRDVAPAVLAAAAVAMARGLVVMDRASLSAIAPVRERPQQPLETLTPREREVLGLVAEGLSNRAIGTRLAISEHTVKFHVNAVLGKLGVQRRMEAVTRAIRLGYLVV